MTGAVVCDRCRRTMAALPLATDAGDRQSPRGKEHDMENELLERRALEQLIRRAEAEERLLERRLDRLELEQWRERRSIHMRLHDELWRRFAG